MGHTEEVSQRHADNRLWGVTDFNYAVKFRCGHLGMRGKKDKSRCFECVVDVFDIPDASDVESTRVAFCAQCSAERGMYIRVPEGEDTCQRCQAAINERISQMVPTLPGG